jgi:hypothetical protein
MNQEQKDLLSRLYENQPLTTDDLHHTSEFLGPGGFCDKFNAVQTADGRKAYSAHDIYKSLLLLRKNGELTTKTGRARPATRFGNDNANST